VAEELVAWQKVESLATVVLAIAAVSIAVVTVRREVIGGGPSTSQSPQLKLENSKDWERILGAAMPVMAGDDRVHIVEFTDFECPACRHFHLNILSEALEGVAIQPSFSIVHLPLRGHRFAEIAATAAECAAEQGRAQSFVDAVFLRQDSIGLAAWTEFAAAAQVPDSVKFQECLAAGPGTRVLDGRALAAELGLRETPTIYLNGQRLSRPPSAEELRNLITTQESQRFP